MKYVAPLLALLALPIFVFAQEKGFVSLTNIPILYETGNAFSLDAFLNNLYKICIGIAAVVAVLQIMRAGVMYMGGDSVTEKKEAKNLIGLAIGGLILVLSPVVVFSIINPDILSLKIGNLDDLKVELSQEAKENTLWADTTSDRAAAKARCDAAQGATTFTCTPKAGGTGRTVSLNEPCTETENGSTVCRRTNSTPTGQSCSSYTDRTAASTGVCDASRGFTQIGATCCGTLAAGAVCCGKNLTEQEEEVPTPEPEEPTATTTATSYGWRGRFENTTGAVATQQQGPFTTQAACQSSLSTWPQANGQSPTGDFTCTCNTPIGQQASCTGF